MGGNCRCGDRTTGGGDIPGLFFTVPGCHTSEGGPLATVASAPPSLRFVFLVEFPQLALPAAAGGMGWPEGATASLTVGHPSLVSPPPETA